MSKFIESEIYGNCDVNNNSTSHGKVYNDDILYVSFSQFQEDPDAQPWLLEITVHVRRFDNIKTNSGVPMVHWWFAYSGSDASSNQGPVPIDDQGAGTATLSFSEGYILYPTVGTSIDAESATLNTSIASATTHNFLLQWNGGIDAANNYTKYLNVMVQGIVYSEKIDYLLLVD